jgi:hypothetical protein
MSHDALSAERLVSAALIDSLAAELIGSGLVRSGRLADRIEAAAERHEPAGQSVLKAFARGLRERRPPDLSLIQGGLAEPGGPVSGPEDPGSNRP